MKFVLIILFAIVEIQDTEYFGQFYYKNFKTDRDFKMTRIKYPLTLTDVDNQTVKFDKWEDGIDTLTTTSDSEVFIHGTNSTLVFWDKKDCTIQNEFTRLDGRWYLTGVKLNSR
jgi:hypothetical protein